MADRKESIKVITVLIKRLFVSLFFARYLAPSTQKNDSINLSRSFSHDNVVMSSLNLLSAALSRVIKINFPSPPLSLSLSLLSPSKKTFLYDKHRIGQIKSTEGGGKSNENTLNGNFMHNLFVGKDVTGGSGHWETKKYVKIFDEF